MELYKNLVPSRFYYLLNLTHSQLGGWSVTPMAQTPMQWLCKPTV